MQVRIEKKDKYSVDAVYVNDTRLRVLCNDTSRSVWTDKHIVIKVDRGTPQAQREAETYTKLDLADRCYFPRLLMVGIDFVVEEYVPLVKLPDVDHTTAHNVEKQAFDLFKKYALDWDWQGWRQFGIDKRTGTLCIHDFPCYDEHLSTTHNWVTI